MTTHVEETGHDENALPVWRRPVGMAVATAALIAAFYLLREHWGHIWGFWPYLLLLACPLMHLVHGHGGHGGQSHGGHAGHSPDPARTTTEKE